MEVPRLLWSRRIAFLTAISITALSSRLLTTSVSGQIAVKRQGYVPYSDPPINYLSDDLHDPIADLQKQIDSGSVTLQYDERLGYLPSVLKLLKIPPHSQTLVFSKTSFQYKKISPEHPRALYFNDDVYIGFVHQGKALEVISFDPDQGAIFYLLDANKAEHPTFNRAELDCTQCHIAPATRGVPGVLLRSIFPTATGTQAANSTSFVTGQESPLSQRWGGWYVTGTAGAQRSMGNAVVQDLEHPEQLNKEASVNVHSLEGRFSKMDYLNAESDIVAHLVLAHQTQAHNLLTLTNYKTRIALFNAAQRDKDPDGSLNAEEQASFEKPAEELVQYLLFANEAPLTGQVEGYSGFSRAFAAQGPRDTHGRSLRDFDLHSRIFRYPVSYLIYSESFDRLPDPAKQYVFHRIYQVLSGEDKSPAFSRLSAADRTAAYQILLATKPNLPTEWHQSAAAAARAERLSRRPKTG